MKRQAKRVKRTISPEREAEARQIGDRIFREERRELSAKARKAFREYDAARTELKRVAELLKKERTKQKLSLADLHERTGITRAALCRLENLVEVNPKIDTLNRIAEAMGKRLIVALGEK